jgi:uncharacterized protein
MHYYIDGYNLMFRSHTAGDNLQAQREKIVFDLNAKIQFLKLKATLVFDAAYCHGDSTQSHFKYIKILFSAQGQTADELILAELQACGSSDQQVVVTSDKQLAYQARRLHAQTESVEEFLEWLNKRCANKLKKSRAPKINLQRPQLPTVQSSKTPLADQKTSRPSDQASSGECFTYYLNAFEKLFEETQKAPLSSNPQKKRLRSRVKPPQKKPPVGLSDMQRWLKAFEQE